MFDSLHMSTTLSLRVHLLGFSSMFGANTQLWSDICTLLLKYLSSLYGINILMYSVNSVIYVNIYNES